MQLKDIIIDMLFLEPFKVREEIIVLVSSSNVGTESNYFDNSSGKARE